MSLKYGVLPSAFYDNQPLEEQVEILGRYLMLNFPGEFKGEGAIEMAIRLLRKMNTSSNGGSQPKEAKKKVASTPMKHQVGKFVIGSVIGAIITGLLELAYERKFINNDEEDD